MIVINVLHFKIDYINWTMTISVLSAQCAIPLNLEITQLETL